MWATIRVVHSKLEMRSRNQMLALAVSLWLWSWALFSCYKNRAEGKKCLSGGVWPASSLDHETLLWSEAGTAQKTGCYHGGCSRLSLGPTWGRRWPTPTPPPHHPRPGGSRRSALRGSWTRPGLAPLSRQRNYSSPSQSRSPGKYPAVTKYHGAFQTKNVNSLVSRLDSKLIMTDTFMSARLYFIIFIWKFNNHLRFI